MRIESSTFLDENILVNSPGNIFCKIDTEGHEPHVIIALRGSRHWRRISDLYVEADEDFYDVPRLTRDLEADGFLVVHRSGALSAHHYDLHFQRVI